MAQAVLHTGRFTRLYELGQMFKALFKRQHVTHWTECLRDDVRK
ncbi:hypothetical protein [uncultured Shimia sp.]|nr:hypothetical protein [uncultured Shimia sp.]